jgi:PAS domain S-box-containing protein
VPDADDPTVRRSVATPDPVPRELLDDWPHPVLALELDRAPRLVFWNRQAERLLGYPSVDPGGQPAGTHAFVPRCRLSPAQAVRAPATGAAKPELEWTLTRQDGQKIRLAWSLLPLAQAGASRVFWLVGVDVSRRLVVEQALRGRDRLLRACSGICLTWST